MPEDFELNSLERFSKHSPKLVLEEHSHCEIPAGCGGVVMRWLNPALEQPLLFRIFSRGEREVFLDGEPLTSSRVLLPLGRHLLCIRLEGGVPGEASFLMTAKQGLVVNGARSPKQVCWASEADGQWLGIATPPEADWLRADYRGQGWTPLTELPFPESEDNAWRTRQLREDGARPLGLSECKGELWVRREFEVQP